jgi:hypothetical protein
MWVLPTVTASTMIARMRLWSKVGCHSGLWEGEIKGPAQAELGRGTLGKLAQAGPPAESKVQACANA